MQSHSKHKTNSKEREEKKRLVAMVMTDILD